MYYWTPLRVASLRQLLASFQQHWEAPWPCCYTFDSHCRICFEHWEVSLNVNEVSPSLIRQWISPYSSVDASNCFLGGTMQDSVECAGPQKHNGESPVFIRCIVLELQLFFLIPSSKASCFVEASHLVEDIQNNGYISRTIRCINTGWFSRYGCYSERLPLNVMLLQNTMPHWTGSRRTAVSREPCNI